MARPVERWLGTFMCAQYAGTFEAYGYKTLQSVCQLTMPQLQAMALLPEHCEEIMENVSVLRQSYMGNMMHPGGGYSDAQSYGGESQMPVNPIGYPSTPGATSHQMMDQSAHSITTQQMASMQMAYSQSSITYSEQQMYRQQQQQQPQQQQSQQQQSQQPQQQQQQPGYGAYPPAPSHQVDAYSQMSAYRAYMSHVYNPAAVMGAATMAGSPMGSTGGGAGIPGGGAGMPGGGAGMPVNAQQVADHILQMASTTYTSSGPSVMRARTGCEPPRWPGDGATGAPQFGMHAPQQEQGCASSGGGYCGDAVLSPAACSSLSAGSAPRRSPSSDSAAVSPAQYSVASPHYQPTPPPPLLHAVSSPHYQPTPPPPPLQSIPSPHYRPTPLPLQGVSSPHYRPTPPPPPLHGAPSPHYQPTPAPPPLHSVSSPHYQPTPPPPPLHGAPSPHCQPTPAHRPLFGEASREAGEAPPRALSSPLQSLQRLAMLPESLVVDPKSVVSEASLNSGDAGGASANEDGVPPSQPERAPSTKRKSEKGSRKRKRKCEPKAASVTDAGADDKCRDERGGGVAGAVVERVPDGLASGLVSAAPPCTDVPGESLPVIAPRTHARTKASCRKNLLRQGVAMAAAAAAAAVGGTVPVARGAVVRRWTNGSDADCPSPASDELLDRDTACSVAGHRENGLPALHRPAGHRTHTLLHCANGLADRDVYHQTLANNRKVPALSPTSEQNMSVKEIPPLTRAPNAQLTGSVRKVADEVSPVRSLDDRLSPDLPTDHSVSGCESLQGSSLNCRKLANESPVPVVSPGVSSIDSKLANKSVVSSPGVSSTDRTVIASSSADCRMSPNTAADRGTEADDAVLRDCQMLSGSSECVSPDRRMSSVVLAGGDTSADMPTDGGTSPDRPEVGDRCSVSPDGRRVSPDASADYKDTAGEMFVTTTSERFVVLPASDKLTAGVRNGFESADVSDAAAGAALSRGVRRGGVRKQRVGRPLALPGGGVNMVASRGSSRHARRPVRYDHPAEVGEEVGAEGRRRPGRPPAVCPEHAERKAFSSIPPAADLSPDTRKPALTAAGKENDFTVAATDHKPLPTKVAAKCRGRPAGGGRGRREAGAAGRPGPRSWKQRRAAADRDHLFSELRRRAVEEVADADRTADTYAAIEISSDDDVSSHVSSEVEYLPDGLDIDLSPPYWLPIASSPLPQAEANEEEVVAPPIATTTPPPPPKRKCGRPAGSKNKRAQKLSPKLSPSALKRQARTAAASVVVGPSSVAPSPLTSPAIRVVGSRASPVSCTVVNGTLDCYQPEVTKKSHRKTTAVRLDDSAPYLCVFCGQTSSHAHLGDLFGPYQPEGGGRAGPAATAARVDRRRASDPTAPVADLPAEMWLHEDCLVWCNGVYMAAGRLHGLDDAVTIAKQTRCSVCREMGATLGCSRKGCQQKCHFLCAQDEGYHMDDQNFSLLCPKHKDHKVKLVTTSVTST